MVIQASYWLVVLFVLGVTVAPYRVWAYGTEISSTVTVFRLTELTDVEYIDGQPGTRCEHMVTKAAAYGTTRVNFMVTHFFKDQNNDYIPDEYCYKPDASSNCLPFTQDVISNWIQKFTPCLQHAVNLGFTGFAFTPHADIAVSGPWRNAMLINPLAKYGGYGWTDIMLVPLAQAMNAVLDDGLTVWFALQGEMSAMVMRYPQEHQRLLPYLKSLMLSSRPDLAANVRMGLAVNENKLCGLVECNPQMLLDPVYNLPAIRALFQAVDFYGISAYPKYSPGDLSTMEEPIQNHMYELKMFGINLAQLINVQGKEFFYSEFGIGGGIAQDGHTPAQTAEQAASAPYFGIFDGYTRQLDPWKNHLPSTIIVQTRQYLEEFYKAAALWLLRKGGPTIRIDGVFIWNLNSWDVQGIHPTSTTKEGTYRVAMVAETITNHNLQTSGRSWASANLNPGSIPPY